MPAGGDSLHGEEERVLQPRVVLAAGVELNQALGRACLRGALWTMAAASPA
jgi:hypothetical protein